VAALLMAWMLLGQQLAPVQWAGAVLVVAAVVGLGLRKGASNQTPMQTPTETPTETPTPTRTP
jgi:drug/metabolite transporter (DMT)-like permease